MTDQRDIIDHLRKTLELLDVEGAKKTAHVNTEGKASLEIQPKKSFDEYSQAYIDFTYGNPTTYHVVDYSKKLLEKAGFEYLSEKENWDTKVTKGSKFYTIRNGTNLSAFIIGKNWSIEKGVGVIGTHADALTAKLKPSSKKDEVEGFELLGVAPYGGTLNELWFDRDLGIGGRILYRDESDTQIKAKLVDSTPHPIARIPTLAPHFGVPAEGPFDKEDQAVPIVSYASPDSHVAASSDEKKSPLYGKHDIDILRYIAELAKVKVEQLVQVDLDLFDVQKGVIGGIKNDFLFAPRLDDRLCTFAAVNALIEYSQVVDTDSMDTFIDVTLFDNEEIGSLSRQGAKGGLLESVVSRVSKAYLGQQDVDLRTLFANSVILSADVNHMFNPNFASVYMKNHSPKPNVGVTLSLDPNVHMSTDVVGTAFIEELARLNDDKIQYFQIKNNSRSGGTIGPSISSQTGARAIDLGIPQLSMHSIRAATGSKDVGLGVKFFKNFLNNWRPVYDQFGDL